MAVDRNGTTIAVGTDYVVIGECRTINDPLTTIVVGTTPLTVHCADIEQATAARTPSSHVLATNAALGGEHTISGASNGMLLQATGATTAKFMVPDSAVNIESTLGHLIVVTGSRKITGSSSNFYAFVDGLDTFADIAVPINRSCKLGRVGVSCYDNSLSGFTWRFELRKNGAGSATAYKDFTWPSLGANQHTHGTWDSGGSTTFVAGDEFSLYAHDNAGGLNAVTDVWFRCHLEFITT